jgi:uncharacterized protein with NRDE domain
MCLLLFAWKAHPFYPLILAANRDEFYERPSAPADFWEDAPELLAGRDLKEGGTWLGLTRSGRLAALTNYRDPASLKIEAPSRGRLTTDYLLGNEKPQTYLERIAPEAFRYNGFSLLVGDFSDLFYLSNRGTQLRLAPGIYGLSNSLLDVPWPKVARGKKRLGDLLSKKVRPTAEAVFKFLSDRSRPPDNQLPETGVGLEWERILSPLFIQSAVYGTRSSTALFIDRDGNATFSERVFDERGVAWMTTRIPLPVETAAHR